ncbi:hypothetical protein PG1C_04365 [Rugosibacter aromaticivorans]|uniref:Uncharacterized protein n=1 Tax=Rugosibacter aromaticivorans TaxID=1565605 RepID=A0A0C5JKK3_9PROT|nr:hypothetical protein [Rugosibacter aromaticivorans]AJP47911.1 hypothetical protein PG1C_04365 [Rugosibacter aromaticivorans]
MDYLKYFLPSAVLTLTGIGVLAGGVWVWMGLALFAVMAIPDILMGFDFSVRRMSTPGALFMLFSRSCRLPFFGLPTGFS